MEHHPAALAELIAPIAAGGAWVVFHVRRATKRAHADQMAFEQQHPVPYLPSQRERAIKHRFHLHLSRPLRAIHRVVRPLWRSK